MIYQYLIKVNTVIWFKLGKHVYFSIFIIFLHLFI
ncbi:hypothetical protein J2S09_001795 [Bacillus fengqiuensis]|nr:hypothetical protein [Bacillus fengqiuensis]